MPATRAQLRKLSKAIPITILGSMSTSIAQSGRTAIIHEGLRALIQRESARRLAKLGGSEPALRLPSRRRPKGATAK